MSKKSKSKIQGGFVALEHNLIESEAYKSLSKTAKIAFTYFKRDLKNGHQTEVILTFEQAQKYGVCNSPTTFNSAKKMLVQFGFLDCHTPGGLGKESIFSLSYRWKRYGTPDFESLDFQPGFGSKYFETIWKNEKKREKLIEARHSKKPNTGFV